ncbi:MAG: PmoA family protein [Gemmataceae bacterium]|nr:PmoA family protein [Gemmataceae bacterium]MCI0741510.1 PmoA family protein [Gemmataceae bacterium]
MLPRFLLAAALLAATACPALAQRIEVKTSADHVEFYANKELVTRYHIAKTYAKPIFWPVHAPGEVPLTRAWPIVKDIAGESTDHIHQKSVWFCHGDVIPEGIELKDKIRGVEGVDFWSEAKGHGRIVCTKVEKPVLGRLGARVETHNEWCTSDGTKIMNEKRILGFYDFGKARLLVLDIDLCASVVPITFGDTKEGAMGIRILDQLRADKVGKGKLQNAEGKVGEKECWGHVSAWSDYSGPIGARIVGLTVMADPENPHPTCWHSRGYGLNAANPFGRNKAAFPAMKGRTDLVKLAKGDHLKLRYGILLHEGDAESGRVADYFQRFVTLRSKE